MNGNERRQGRRALARARSRGVQEHEAVWDGGVLGPACPDLWADVELCVPPRIPRPGLGEILREIKSIQLPH